MTPDELERTLVSVGIVCRVKGDEVIVQTCPYCGNDRWNMEINVVNGMASCWACRQPQPGLAAVVIEMLTGDSYRIPVHGKSERGESPPPNVVTAGFKSCPADEIPSARLYLERRAIGPALIREHGIVVCTENDHLFSGRIAIPVPDYWTGEPVGWVARTYTNRRPKYVSQIRPDTIAGWRRRLTPCVVVEGPLDAILARAAGFSVAMLAGTWNPAVVAWASRVPHAVDIVVMLDGSAMEESLRLYWNIRPVHERTSAAMLAIDDDPAGIGVAGIRAAVESVIRIAGRTLLPDGTTDMASPPRKEPPQ